MLGSEVDRGRVCYHQASPADPVVAFLIGERCPRHCRITVQQCLKGCRSVLKVVPGSIGRSSWDTIRHQSPKSWNQRMKPDQMCPYKAIAYNERQYYSLQYPALHLPRQTSKDGQGSLHPGRAGRVPGALRPLPGCKGESMVINWHQLSVRS